MIKNTCPHVKKHIFQRVKVTGVSIGTFLSLIGIMLCVFHYSWMPITIVALGAGVLAFSIFVLHRLESKMVNRDEMGQYTPRSIGPAWGFS